MSKDIDTIPTKRRRIVSYKILVEWSDNLVELKNDMGGHPKLENIFNDWLCLIEDEENEDAK